MPCILPIGIFERASATSGVQLAANSILHRLLSYLFCSPIYELHHVPRLTALVVLIRTNSPGTPSETTSPPRKPDSKNRSGRNYSKLGSVLKTTAETVLIVYKFGPLQSARTRGGGGDKRTLQFGVSSLCALCGSDCDPTPWWSSRGWVTVGRLPEGRRERVCAPDHCLQLNFNTRLNCMVILLNGDGGPRRRRARGEDVPVTRLLREVVA